MKLNLASQLFALLSSGVFIAICFCFGLNAQRL